MAINDIYRQIKMSRRMILLYWEWDDKENHIVIIIQVPLITVEPSELMLASGALLGVALSRLRVPGPRGGRIARCTRGSIARPRGGRIAGPRGRRIA